MGIEGQWWKEMLEQIRKVVKAFHCRVTKAPAVCSISTLRVHWVLIINCGAKSSLLVHQQTTHISQDYAT